VIVIVAMLAMTGLFVRVMFVSLRNDGPPRRLLDEIKGYSIVVNVQGRLLAYFRYMRRASTSSLAPLERSALLVIAGLAMCPRTCSSITSAMSAFMAPRAATICCRT